MIRLYRSIIGQAEIAAVNAVLTRGFLGTGPETQSFEQELAEFLGGGVEVACVVNNTAALQVALQAAGLARGEVTSPYAHLHE